MGLRRPNKHRGRRIGAVLLLTAFFLTQMIADPVISNAEESTAREQAMDAMVSVQEKKRHPSKERNEENDEVALKELQTYQKELLRFPKKDRLRFGQDADYTYNTNSGGSRIHNQEGNSTYRINPFINLDLGGQKTDIRFEYRWNRSYNNFTPQADAFSQEGTLRFGRRILPKTNLSLNQRLTRASSRVAGLDNKKISWDSTNRVGLNYEFHPKIQMNLEANYARLFFTQEDFDETGTRNFQLDPSVVLVLTPKTRLTLGYQWSLPRVHTEASDTINHVFRVSYSGKVTAKSSVSADLSYTLRDPASARASKGDSVASSVGYMWQVTPKTGLRFLYSNSVELSLSDSISGVSLLKTETRTTSDTLSLSIRWRAHRRINTEFSFTPSHSHSKTKRTGDANVRSRTFTFPFQVALDIDLVKWLKLRLAYTYRHKIGNEHKTDENRNHTWFVGTNVAF